MLSRPLFLIGMPGTGKTYWAGVLGRFYNCSSFDLDKIIIKKTGLSITDFFNKEGEAAFREIEQACLQEIILSQNAPYVLATGGGTPCFGNSLSVMQQAGCVVYLKAHLNTLILRLQKNYHHRPLLADNLNENTAQLLHRRQHIYEQAEVIVEVENLSKTILIEHLKSCINHL